MEFNLLIFILLAVFCLNCFIAGMAVANSNETPIGVIRVILINLFIGSIVVVGMFFLLVFVAGLKKIDRLIHFTFWRNFYFSDIWRNISDEDLAKFNNELECAAQLTNGIKSASYRWILKAVNKRHNYTHSKQNN